MNKYALKLALVLAFLIFFIFLLTGCSYYEESSEIVYDDYPLATSYPSPTPKDLRQTSDYYISRFRDPMTGVNYLVFKSTYGGGICPRYNADGTVYVTDENGKLIDGYLNSLDIENITDIDDIDELEPLE